MKHTITVIGLGAGDYKQMQIGVYETLKQAKTLYLRTKEHPVVEKLEEEGLHVQSFDHVYEQNASFDDVYETIVSSLIAQVQHEDIVYAVPGHPLVAEKTVQLLLEKQTTQNFTVHIAGGQSFIDAMFASVNVDPIEGCQILDGPTLALRDIKLTQHQFICQVYDSFVASHVKLTLMELLPDDYDVYICEAVGSAAEQVKKVPLYELDRQMEVSNLTTIYVPKVTDDTLLYRTFDQLKDVIAALRSENGCPWDKEQTHETLKKYLVEETYEVLEAIDEQDVDHLIEELGDVLLQVMLHAQIGADEGFFTIEDVLEGITSKMIRRHPHVFGEVDVHNTDEVLQNWDQIKKKEKENDPKQSLLSGIPLDLPSLYRAYEVQKKAAKVGFDWTDVNDVWDKLQEELKEWQEALDAHDKEESEKELGDVFFALVNLARFYRLDPEEAIRKTIQKFCTRFRYIEMRVKESGRLFKDFTLDELDAFWEQAKEQEE